MPTIKRLVLAKGREASIRRGHLWVFSGAIDADSSDPAENGEIVDLFSNNSEFLARGLYSNKGSIAVRILSFEETPIDSGFIDKRLSDALSIRKTLGLLNNQHTNCYRLVNAEGDLLPGLTIDIYNTAAVIEAHNQGIFNLSSELLVGLRNILPNLTTIYAKRPHSNEGHFLFGAETKQMVVENEIKYEVDFVSGQKTGLFLDQRENRLGVRTSAANRSVLDLFCYNGGFSINSILGQASSLLAVDSSETALSRLEHNFKLNFKNSSVVPEIECGDAFQFMERLDRKFDLIILDPPALAKSRKDLKVALSAYTFLNSRALASLNPGGLLYTFSCSQHVSRSDFEESVAIAASRTNILGKTLRRLHQSACHPVLLSHPETEHLKGLLIIV